ncbi:hypothetical protein ABK905_16320 [Acerihabitans sp. KWT182]|uniref:Uncharacterized protein n=1 Tax=Acerihabitans sp. KWT182 TaxID=3157919 RepID=A0AAU7Q5U7_9GAMM
MAELTKETMLYNDYNWARDPKYGSQNHEMEAAKIDRHAGKDVLRYINQWPGSDEREVTPEDRLYLEWIIREKLPTITVLTEEVTEFLLNAYPYNRAEFKKSKEYRAHKLYQH